MDEYSTSGVLASQAVSSEDSEAVGRGESAWPFFTKANEAAVAAPAAPGFVGSGCWVGFNDHDCVFRHVLLLLHAPGRRQLNRLGMGTS